ncbi:hypothetical protein K2X83_01080 [Patescibacteria group bacterium]|nr:hypothetical protein [Patescibacteria group bacterium]
MRFILPTTIRDPLILAGIGVFILGFFLATDLFFGSTTAFRDNPQEVTELAEVPDWTFQDYATYFRKVAEEKGGAYAFDVLKRAEISPNVDIHLLAHVVGDILYKQKGIEGIKICTPDFRNACSHSIVIGMLTEHGESSLPEIVATCKQAPGGKGAYTMCFHGLGHGVLAFNEYRLEKAVEMCKKTGTAQYNNREYIECVGGASMEMMAGVHDRDAWEKQRENYFEKDDPLAPCNATFMPAEVRPICYIHLTPHLFEAAGMSLGKPDPAYYARSFSYCDKISVTNISDRQACYGGFGKEFTVFAQERDVRNIGDMQEPALKRVREWCALAGDVKGERDCNAYALNSLFWGGENNPDASFTYCAIAPDPEQSRLCYELLAENISIYLGPERGRAVCMRIPLPYRNACLTGSAN